MQSFTTEFTVEQTPEQAYAAINNVRGWWSGNIEGSTDQLGAEFTYRYKDIHYSKQRISELIPDKLTVWEVLDAHLNFVADPREWIGSEIRFELEPVENGTRVRFTHHGLVPDFECYENCSSAWGFYINTSLRDLIADGRGAPNDTQAA